MTDLRQANGRNRHQAKATDKIISNAHMQCHHYHHQAQSYHFQMLSEPAPAYQSRLILYHLKADSSHYKRQ